MSQRQEVIDYMQTEFIEHVRQRLILTKVDELGGSMEVLAKQVLADILKIMSSNELEQAKTLLARATRLEPDGLETYKLTVIDFLNGDLASLRKQVSEPVSEAKSGVK